MSEQAAADSPDTTTAATAVLRASALAELEGYRPGDARQEQLRADFVQHLHDEPDGLWRGGPPAHLTASALVLDPTGTRALLTLHRRGGFWGQFGGHLEPGDTSLADAALREAAEESGVEGLRLLTGPVDLDRHTLSSAFGRCREHLDVRFAAVAPADADPVVSDESVDVAWWPVDALPDGVVADLGRLLAAARAALA